MTDQQEATFSKYAQFSHPENEPWDHETSNYFNCVSPQRILQAEAAGNFNLPNVYAKFLTSVGSGIYKRDSQGRHLNFRGNYFLPPEDILKYLRKETVEWQADPQYLQTNEIPFFDVGDDILLVFRRDDLEHGAVYEQYGERPRFLSLEEFLEALYDDVDVYRSSLFQD